MRFLSYALVTLLCYAPFITFAQDAQVKGVLKDSINNSIPSNTIVILLRPSDSTMVSYARADSKGAFHMTGVPAGNYLLWIYHPSFAPYRDSVQLKAGVNDQGDIFLTLRSKIMQEIVIKGVSPIRLKGDTIEYKADSFAVRPGSTTEDLLKRLPGIQVDRFGKITAQGQQVKKVLVDGEEFFSDDPTVATRNIAASAIDKVQVFDKKSDQAVFTGIDDGQTTKTINLRLKNDRKQGYFGKINASLGSSGLYENTAAINIFEKKRKIAIFGVAANTGKAGLNGSDADKYSSSGTPAATPDDGGGIAISYGGSNSDFTNWGGSYNGQGVPVALNAGAHYSNKWFGDKLSLNGDYIFNQVNVGVNTNTVSQLKLPDSTTNLTNDNNFSRNVDMQHSLNTRYDFQIDTLNDLKFTISGKVRHKNTFIDDTSFTTGHDSAMINNSMNRQDFSGQNNSLNSTLTWMMKTHKKGRTLFFNTQENYNKISSTGYQVSAINLYNAGVPQGRDTTDQYKISDSRNLALVSKLIYTEPLGDNIYLVMNYGLNLLSAASDMNAYNRDAGGKYVTLDSLYSNYYKLNILTNSAGAILRKAAKKMNYSLGTNVGYTYYKQSNLYADSVRRRAFINWYPKASFTYRPKQSVYFSVNYSGATTQPSLDQMQPVASNSNPLHIVIGNPGLKPSYSSLFMGNFNKYNMLKERGINLFWNYNIVNNAFSTRDSVDTFGKQYSQTVNVANTQNAYVSGNYNFKWRGPDVRMGVGSGYSFTNFPNYVNGVINNTHSDSYGFYMNFSKYKDKDFSISLNGEPSYHVSHSSVQSSANLNYWSYSFGWDASKDLPMKFVFSADANMNFYQKTGAFTNHNMTLVNASISKMFFKNNDLVIKLTANDLFNQNIGFYRTMNTNLATQTTYTAIHRYYLLSVTWNFSKNGKPGNL